MTTLYLNDYHQEIHEDVAISLGNYLKVIKIKGRVEQAHHYMSGKLQHVVLYVSSTQSSINLHIAFDSISKTIYKEEGKFLTYTLYAVEDFDRDNILISRKREVLAENNSLIYYEIIDINTSKASMITKHLYEADHDVSYEFSYDVNTGKFKYLEASDPRQHYDTKYWRLSYDALRTGMNDFKLTWEGLDYYKHAEPALPIKAYQEFRQHSL